MKQKYVHPVTEWQPLQTAILCASGGYLTPGTDTGGGGSPWG